MHTQKSHPGKFESNASQLLAEAVYKASLDGGNEELGDVENFGYFTYVQGKRYHFILSEDSNGFVHVTYGNPEKMQAKWEKIEAAYEKYCEEVEEEE